jgi:hypothetical protein
MHKGESLSFILDGMTTTFHFDKEGARAKNNLVLVSTPNEQFNPESQGAAGTPREGLTREYERNTYQKEIGDDRNYDIRKGVTYLVNLNQNSSEVESTGTLTHELTVHVDQNVQRTIDIEKNVLKGVMKPGTQAYADRLQTIQGSANKDHSNLARGLVTQYQTISEQMDQLKNTKQYTESYNQDVNSYKK